VIAFGTIIATIETVKIISGDILAGIVVGGSCGVTFTQQQWVFCRSDGASVVFATPGDLVIDNNAITVSGYSSFPTGTKIYATGIVLP
jgi:hypothetical protein